MNRMPNEHRPYDASADRFEHMQKELLLSNLDSMPFRQAQTRTNPRVRQRLQPAFSLANPFYSYSKSLTRPRRKNP